MRLVLDFNDDVCKECSLYSQCRSGLIDRIYCPVISMTRSYFASANGIGKSYYVYHFTIISHHLKSIYFEDLL